MAEIRFKGKDNKKMCVRLSAGMKPILVGRTGNVPVLLPNSSVSRKHCEIREEGGQFILEDLKSANGTRVNGKLLKAPHQLTDGDHIQCGEVSVFYEHKDEAVGKATVKSKGLQRKKRPTKGDSASEKKTPVRKSTATAEKSAAPAKETAPKKGAKTEKKS